MLIKIKFKKPPNATVDDVGLFVLDTLQWAGGCRHPDDPMFNSLRGKIEYVEVHGKRFVDSDDDTAAGRSTP